MVSDPYMIAVGIVGNRPLTDELLAEVMALLPKVLPEVTADILEETRKQLESTVGVSVTVGEGLHDSGQDPWLNDAKGTVKWEYWDAYAKQLASSRWPREVVRVLDEDTDNVLNECGNPRREAAWQIRGLVMGDVQSGKTANYCGLINKAADAGYRFIILLTGMLEDLRAQSQERMDEGFVGRDSRFMITGARPNQRFGVGRFRERVPNILTSVDSDFLTANSKALGGIPLRNITEPVLLVMKKNKTPLTKLLEFVDSQLAPGASRLDMPMMLLDDEADSASVNARKDEDPATINRLIREVLSRFSRASYVAYTATPFANVFINPDYDDLFPANFIYSLKTPTNYVGVTAVFGPDGPFAYQAVDILDAAPAFPRGHKKGWVVPILPASLKDAVGAYLLSCTVRDLRKEPLKHRSMLVNVTTLTTVQNQVAELIKAYLYELVEEVKQYAADDELWSRHGLTNRMYELWREHYGHLEFNWDEVRRALYESVASVKVLTINQDSTASEKLNYGAYRETAKGRRVIAVGGLTLSRGLTLEGLCVSYFYRNSKAYDTLLQMGRWFGYRTGYEDVCRVWMDPDVQDSFSHIADVVEELRFDIRRMHVAKQPPRQFGIRVRSHPDTLIVTALNKMRNAKEVEVEISFSEKLAETPFLPKDLASNERNRGVAADFVSGLPAPEIKKGRCFWHGVEASKVSALLAQLHISPANSAFMPDLHIDESPLVEFIRNNEYPTLQDWDVCLPQGEGMPVSGVSVRTSSGQATPTARQRQFEKVPKGSVFLKLNKQRVGDVSDEKVGLRDTDIAEAEADWAELRREDPKKGVTAPGWIYRRRRQRPLLTLHLLEPVSPSDPLTKAGARMMRKEEIEPRLLVAVSLSFPKFEENDQKKRVLYRLNKIALQNMGLVEDDAEDED
jgi:hypothetical protein